jgi:hypothetical protein
MLENLSVAPKQHQSPLGAVAIEFDGTEGTATTPPLREGADFHQFLIDAGYPPDQYEVVGTPRTSRWQQREGGEWLTSYRFQFRRITAIPDLPTLYAAAKRKTKFKPLKATTDKAVIVCWSDLQIGKVDHRGGVEQLVERVAETKTLLLDYVKREKPTQIVVMDVGDLIENFSNAANLQQLRTNDLSIMQQLDLAATILWDLLKDLAALVPNLVYASVGSNHCQWRVQKQVVGTPTDDWGVFIGRQLARLAQETSMPIRFFEPATHDESLTLDVLGHRIGLIHGHQVARPEGLPDFWRKSSFGNSPISAAQILVSGHFHHLRVTELGIDQSGASRFWIQAATLDNGSGWYMRTSGEDSRAGLVVFNVEKGKPFNGRVDKLIVCD